MRSVLISLLALAVLALAACGGNSSEGSSGPLTKAEYEERFNEIAKRFSDGPEPKGDEADKIEEGLRRAGGMADELDAIEPPADITRAHDDFVAGLRALATSKRYRGVIEALRRGDEKTASELIDEPPVSQDMMRRMASARSEFAEKGYDLGDVSGVPGG